MSRLLVVAALLAAAGCKRPPAPAAPPAPEPPPPAEVKPAPTPPPSPADEDEVPAARKTTAAVSALTGKINLPKDGGRWPAKFAPAAAKVEGKAVRVTTDRGGRFLAVSPESGRFVLAEPGDRRDAKSASAPYTRVALGDLTTGKVLGEWELKDTLVPLDVSPDGTRFLVKTMWHDAKLTLVTVTPDFGLVRKTFVAHDRIILNPTEAPGNQAELHVRWAAFVGNDRVASAAEGGQVSVFRVAGPTKVGHLDGTPGLTPCVTPDRKRLFAHAGGKLVLIDPAEGEAIATRDWPLPSGPKNLAASPDGGRLACAKEDRVRFLDLKTGDFWDQVMPELGDHAMDPKYFSWAGAYLVQGRKVFDPALAFPVWSHDHPAAEAYTPRQVWAAVRVSPPFQKAGEPVVVSVRAYDVTPPDLDGVVEAGKARPGLYVLRPGAAVRADVSKLPAKKQPAAAAALEQRLKELGYRPDPAATPVVTVSLDPQVTKNTPYLGLTNLPYQHQPLRTQFKFGAKTVFEQAAAKEPPGSIFLTGGETLEQRLAREAWGTPDYDGLRTLRLPPHVPGPDYPRQGFGRTSFDADGPRFHK